MAGQVKFVLEAQEAKAVQGFLKIVEAQKKVEAGMGGIHSSGKKAHETTEQIKEAAHDLLIEFVSFETVVKIWENVSEEIHHAYEELVKFNNEQKGGATIGPNLANLPGYRERSKDLSEQFGIPMAQLGPFREHVAIKTSDLSADERAEFEKQSLESFEATKQDPTAVFDAARALRETFPELSVGGAFNWVEFTRQKGGMAAGEQASFFPMVLPAFKELGVTVKEFEALMSTVARAGGRDSTMGRGLIEAVNKFPELADQGIIKPGSGWETILADLKNFHDTDQAGFNKALGKRGAFAAYALASHPEQYAAAMADETKFPTNMTEKIIEKLATDPQAAAALLGERMEVIHQNEPLHMSTDMMQRVSKYEMRKAAAEYATPTGLKWTAAGQAIVSAMLGYAGLDDKRLREGYELLNQGGPGRETIESVRGDINRELASSPMDAMDRQMLKGTINTQADRGGALDYQSLLRTRQMLQEEHSKRLMDMAAPVFDMLHKATTNLHAVSRMVRRNNGQSE